MGILRRFPNIILSFFITLMVIGQPKAGNMPGILAPVGGSYQDLLLNGQNSRPDMPLLENNEPQPDSLNSVTYPGWEPATLTLDVALEEVDGTSAQSGEITNGWTTIMSENFDGTFPNSLWSLVDGNGSTGGNIYWGRETYLHRSGAYSMWAAGTNGPDPASSGYPPDLFAYMIYGPFNTVGAKSASLTFSYWNQSEPEDILYVMASTDPGGQNWSGWRNTVTITEGWRSVTFDLASATGLDIANQGTVRIAFIFYSDDMNTTTDAEKGPFIDDVVLEKFGGPDLTYISPNDPVNPWEGPLIASLGPNTHTSTSLYTHQNTYVDWAIVNQGASTATNFTNCLYLADKLVTCRDWAGLSSGSVMTFEDILMTITPPYGWIPLKLVIDANNTIDEIDETNNIIERSFLWLRPDIPDLLPHAPSGWSYPVVPASITGTNTYFSLRSETSTYIDWAVINLSNAAMTGDFDTCLYLDNNPLACWRVTTDLDAGFFYFRQDQPYSAPAAGQHTLALIADVNNEIVEANEDNNLWQRKFTWYPPGKCGPFTIQPLEVSIPEDGSWIDQDLSLPPSPEGSVVGEVAIKLAIDHPNPDQVEIFLSHEGSPFSARIETAGLDLSGRREVTTVVKRFNGQPAAGDWTLWLRDPVPGRMGQLVNASLSALPSLPGKIVEENAQGAPASFRLIGNTTHDQHSPLGSNQDFPQFTTAPNLTLGWTQVLYETFENSFPGSDGWVLEDRQISDGCQYLWDEDDGDHSPTNGGVWGAWPANGGQDGLDPSSSLYPPNMDSWMIYGPFDLSDASDARLAFDLKRDIETVHDYLFVGASGDGINFSGMAYSGNLGWTNVSIKLTEYARDTSVWVGFRFYSDPSNQGHGPWIDNILIEKAGGVYCSNGLVAGSALTTQELLDAYQAAHEMAEYGQENEPYQILLQSRQFTPTPGLTQVMKAPRSEENAGNRRHFLIQFYETPSPVQTEALAKEGLSLLHYLPDRAWIASAEYRHLANLIQDPAIRWIGPIEPTDRVSPVLNSADVQDLLHNSPSKQMALTVGFAADVPLENGRSLVNTVGGMVMSEVITTNTLLIILPTGRLQELSNADEVIWIEPPLPALDPLNDCVRERTGVSKLQATPYGLDGAGVDLLVYDAATVHAGHPAFYGRLVVGDSNTAWDQSNINHATHVAGTAAGSGYNSPAGRDLKGMAPGANVISYGFKSSGSDSSQYLYTDPGDIEADWGNARAQHGADLGTASIGTNIAANNYDCSWEGNYGAVSQLIDGIVRGSLGAPYITTWAAGNERADGGCGNSYNTTPPPSNAKNPIHVGATNSDSDVIASFSSFGPSDDGRIKPTIVAPGDEQYGDGAVMSTWPPATYQLMSGTSMSTPAVAGLAALMIEQYRNVYQTSGTPLPSTIKALLIHTSVDRGNPGPDYQYGYGRVDGEKAVFALTHGDFIESGFNATGQVHDYPIELGKNIPELRASLAWDDAPASLAASIQLVNNLDLSIIGPDGHIYRPFILNPSVPSANATTGIDSRNNQEQVIIPSPAAGRWTIRIQASNLPVGPQTYSLVFENAQTSNPVPVLNNFFPEKLFVGAQTATLTLNGYNFINLSKVYWNGAAVDTSLVSFLSPNQLKLSIPPSWLASVRTVNIWVVNPDPGGGQSEIRSIPIIIPIKTYLPIIRR